MRKINLTSKRLSVLSVCLISGFALLFSACKSDQSTQSQPGSILPLNSETLDGITNSSIGSAKLSIDTNGYLDVITMNSMSSGVSTDFSSKSSWDETYTINWP